MFKKLTSPAAIAALVFSLTGHEISGAKADTGQDSCACNQWEYEAFTLDDFPVGIAMGDDNLEPDPGIDLADKALLNVLNRDWSNYEIAGSITIDPNKGPMSLLSHKLHVNVICV